MTKVPKDVGASVRARLLRLAHERGEDFQLLLTRYANERLLYRLAQSTFGPRFVLKGAALFTVWTGKPHRATRDLDLLGFGEPNVDALRKIFAEVLALNVGDVEAMVQLGLANSRMKDFYDLEVMSKLFEFDGQLLARAIRATFERRKTPLPVGRPTALTSAFADDPIKNTQWTAFLRKTGASDASDLPATIEAVARFVERPLAAAGHDPDEWSAHWAARGPWTRTP